MKVLLTKDVTGFGRAHEVKEVSNGHAKNFLIPKGLAILASPQLIEKVQKEQREAKEKSEREAAKLIRLKAEIEKLTFTIKGKAGKETLFAQITADQIAEVLRKKLGFAVDAHQIIIENPIKKLGTAQALLKLGQTSAIIKLNIQAHAG